MQYWFFTRNKLKSKQLHFIIANVINTCTNTLNSFITQNRIQVIVKLMPLQNLSNKSIVEHEIDWLKLSNVLDT